MPDQSSAASEHALMQEITAPLETLPDDPLAIVEADFPTAMRGYDRHAVDDYVEQVSRLVAELHATRSPEAAVRRALERVGDQISGILQRAHETSAQITAQSRAEAEDRLQQARRESATMIDAAAQRVRELDADADRIWAERQRIVLDAEDLSGQLLAVARDAVARFPSDEPRAAPALTDDEPDAGDPEDAAVEAWPDAETERPPVDGFADDDETAVVGAAHADEEPELFDGEDAVDLAGDADPDGPQEIERTQAYRPEPERLTDDDSTRVIPPASDAAQHRRDG